LMDSPEHGVGRSVMAGCRDGTMQPAELVEVPFYDREAEIPRGRTVDIPERR